MRKVLPVLDLSVIILLINLLIGCEIKKQLVFPQAVFPTLTACYAGKVKSSNVPDVDTINKVLFSFNFFFDLVYPNLVCKYSLSPSHMNVNSENCSHQDPTQICDSYG